MGLFRGKGFVKDKVGARAESGPYLGLVTQQSHGHGGVSGGREVGVLQYYASLLGILKVHDDGVKLLAGEFAEDVAVATAAQSQSETRQHGSKRSRRIAVTGNEECAEAHGTSSTS